jgi:hypothetical protein
VAAVDGIKAAASSWTGAEIQYGEIAEMYNSVPKKKPDAEAAPQTESSSAVQSWPGL